MEPNWSGFLLAASDFSTVGVVVLVAIGITALTILLAHLIGPRRHGPVKDDTYESGMVPVTSARRRFNVRFYLVAVMYLIFGVEVVFLYPWAVMFPRLREGLTAADAGSAAEAANWAAALADAGYGPGFVLGAILIFFLLLLVGFVYEWRKGVFQWD
jgi:NADH-quinone oxidoreductase subunit A